MTTQTDESVVIEVALVLLRIESRVIHFVWPDTRLTACGVSFSSYVMLSKSWLSGSILCKKCSAELNRRGAHKVVGVLGELGDIQPVPA